MAIEKALEGRPNNKSLRFQTAYTYSQEHFGHLSLYHYRKQIEFHQDDESSLNNLGVQYQKMNMHSHSIKAYRASIERGNTLAMANIAYIFMRVGFLDDAVELLDRARAKEKVDPSVGEAMAASSKIWEAETKIGEVSNEKAREQQLYFSGFVAAAFVAPKKQQNESFSGRWRLPNGTEFEVVQEGDRLSAEWEIGEQNHYLNCYVIHRAFLGVIGYKSAIIYTNVEKRIYGFKSGDPHVISTMNTGNEDD